MEAVARGTGGRECSPERALKLSGPILEDREELNHHRAIITHHEVWMRQIQRYYEEANLWNRL